MNTDQNKPFGYDVASIGYGDKKRTNHFRDAILIDKDQKAQINPAGQFVKVFADIFLKREYGNNSYT